LAGRSYSAPGSDSGAEDGPPRRLWPSVKSGGLFRGEDVGLLDVGVLAQQVGSGLAERGGDRTVQVRFCGRNALRHLSSFIALS